MRVLRYTLQLNLDGTASLKLPVEARIVAWGEREGDICAWAEVGDWQDDLHHVVRFLAVNTGVGFASEGWRYLAMVKVPGAPGEPSEIVWHIYEREQL